MMKTPALTLTACWSSCSKYQSYLGGLVVFPKESEHRQTERQEDWNGGASPWSTEPEPEFAPLFITVHCLSEAFKGETSSAEIILFFPFFKYLLAQQHL